MPKYRCIAFSVLSHWETKQFPEFPHPDSRHQKYRGPVLGTDGSEPSPGATSDRGREPSVSCYIPSLPGVRFYLKYAIEPPYPDGQLFYFKLIINGRNITSWGINPSSHPRGQVLRALCEAEAPDMSSGNSLHPGIESRPFLFAPGFENASAAEDGGLIEVRAYRSKGRKKRPPSVEKCKPQDHYGINLPRAGLVAPQDIKYYDWLLVDPIDEPYAIFRFHYRSWEYLQTLQIIPASQPRILLKPSNSLALLAGDTKSYEEQFEDDLEEVLIDAERFLGSVQARPRRPTAPRRTTSDDIVKRVILRSDTVYGEASTQAEASTEAQDVVQPETDVSRYSVPAETLDTWSYGTQVPRRPRTKPSFEHTRQSSTTSTNSNAPSIAASLTSWADRTSRNISPEPTIAVASAMPIVRTGSPVCTIVSSPPRDSLSLRSPLSLQSPISLQSPLSPSYPISPSPLAKSSLDSVDSQLDSDTPTETPSKPSFRKRGKSFLNRFRHSAGTKSPGEKEQKTGGFTSAGMKSPSEKEQKIGGFIISAGTKSPSEEEQKKGGFTISRGISIPAIDTRLKPHPRPPTPMKRDPNLNPNEKALPMPPTGAYDEQFFQALGDSERNARSREARRARDKRRLQTAEQGNGKVLRYRVSSDGFAVPADEETDVENVAPREREQEAGQVGWI